MCFISCFSIRITQINWVSLAMSYLRLPIIIYKIICIALHLYFSEEKCHPCHEILKVVYDPKFKEKNKQTPKIKLCYYRRFHSNETSDIIATTFNRTEFK